MKVAAIIQARMGSTRLPGKVLKKVLGKTLLEYQIERVKRAKTIDEIIIATTTKENDDPIVQLCQQLSIPYYRGSEEDVLSRYYEAATKFNVDVVVRLTSDCPIIDPVIIDEVINTYKCSSYDYVSNTLVRTFPRGMDTEVFSFSVLEKAHKRAKNKYEREHVTPYIYENKTIFRLGNVIAKENHSDLRLTVDTEEDFELIDKIISNLYVKNNNFLLNDIIDLLRDKPDLILINKHVEQKKLCE